MYHCRLKERERDKTIVIAIAGRAITIGREIKEKTKKIKSYNFTRSNRENSNIAIAIFEH